jgi:hypothetical protein
MDRVFYSNENNIDKINRYFIYFILHFTLYYFHLNETSHGFKLDKKYFNELLQSTPTESDKNATDATDDEEFERKILNIFEFYKQHNKAFTMLDLTKKTKSAIRSMDSLEERERIMDNSENELSDFNYLQRDSRFRYQIWTIDLISHFLLSLDFNYYLFNSEFNNGVVENFLINNLGKLIIVYNSCSSYCQCSVNENNNSKIDLVKIRATSIQLLIKIFKILDKVKK